MSTIKVNNIESSTGGGVVAKLASVNGGFIGTKNLVINGAMQVAQRGTSSTDAGYTTIDRFKTQRSGNDEAPTYEQADVASGTTPYSLGFRKSFKVTNGNQTGATDGDFSLISYVFESQDMANSGWNYTSSSSYITLSFWVKASVPQNYYFSVFTQDGTSHQYTMETGVLTADTWTKITKTIPGNSNVQFDTDTEANRTARGFDVQWVMFRGTNSTGTRPLNAWAAVDSATRVPDMTSTWYTTNNATFELTGVQLEVGSVATDFEHRSFAQELALCQRYYQSIRFGAYGAFNFIGRKSGSGTVVGRMVLGPPMRVAATGTVADAGGFSIYRVKDGSTATSSAVVATHTGYTPYNLVQMTATVSSFSTGDVCTMTNGATAGHLKLDAEI